MRPVAKSKRSSLPAASLWPPRPCAPTMFCAFQTTLRAGDAGDPAVASFGDRERGDAAGRCRRDRSAPASIAATAFACRRRPFALPPCPLSRADAARLGIERRPPAGLQRDQVGPRAAREAEVEADVVVDRIEGAHRDEVEIAPFGIERRRRVAELGLGERRSSSVARAREQLERDVARVGGEGVGEPGAVGRPGEVVAAAVLARVDGAERAALDVADPDLVAMIGERDLAADRRGDERADVAGVPRQRARAPSGGEDDQALLARRRRSPRSSSCRRRATGRGAGARRRRALGAGVPQRRRRGRPRRVVDAPRRRAFPERHREQLAARDDRERMARGMRLEPLEVLAARRRSDAPPACGAPASRSPARGVASLRRDRTARGARRTRRRCGLPSLCAWRA